MKRAMTSRIARASEIGGFLRGARAWVAENVQVCVRPWGA